MRETASTDPADDPHVAISLSEARRYEDAVRANLPRLLATATRILKNPAEAGEAVQDGCLHAFRAFRSFEGRSEIGTWLHRIVINAALARLRVAERLAEDPIDDLMPEYDRYGVLLIEARSQHIPAERLLLDAETRDRVREAIARLPDPYRVLLLLRDIEQLSTRDTAEALGCSEGLVKTRLHRARLALKTLLKPYMSEEG